MSKKRAVPINEKIKADEVMLIGVKGEKLGSFSINKAIEEAQSSEIDLVQVSPIGSEPVVCKLMDYGKYVFAKKRAFHPLKLKSKEHR